MTAQEKNASIGALRKLEKSLQQHLHEQGLEAKPDRPAEAAAKPNPTPSVPRSDVSRAVERPAAPDAQPSPAPKARRPARSRTWARRIALTVGPIVGVLAVVILGLWWRLASGPIDLDLATPWITAAIEENFGQRHRVTIGGTQIERDEHGNTALRIRDIIVRNADGAVVASAPKAEVGVSGQSLLSGRVRAERLSLVDAEMAVRIEPDGKVTVTAGAEPQLLAGDSHPDIPPTAQTPPAPAAQAASPAPAEPRQPLPDLSAILAWIDRLGVTGLDGHDLSEVGLKNGNLLVEDRRTGKRWLFENIDLSLNRFPGGGVGFALGSDSAARPWRLSAAIAPAAGGRRLMTLEADKVSVKDVLLALRIDGGEYEADIPVSARIQADIGPDGIPQALDGRIFAESGSIVEVAAPANRVTLDRLDATVQWDPVRRALMAPFHLAAGGHRITLFAQLDAPSEPASEWTLRMSGGTVMLAATTPNEEPLVFNRIQLRLKVDLEKRIAVIDQGEIGNHDIGLAVSGNFDFADADPRIAIGIAGTRMPVTTFKRLWPGAARPDIRNWVETQLSAGTVERIVIATNASLSGLRDTGVPLPDDGLAIDATLTNAVVTPVTGLPPIRNAEAAIRVTGRTARIEVPRGTIDLSGNRKLVLTNGVFDVPDTTGAAPRAQVRFKVDGPVQAAAELLAMPALRSIAGSPLDPATSRGTLSGQVTLGVLLAYEQPAGATTYGLNIDFTNFSADRLIMGQKIEASALRLTATQQSYQVKGDVKINGVPAALDYRKPRDGDAEIRAQATLDDAGRTRFGLNLNGMLTGPVPVKLNGRIPPNEQDSRFSIDADLAQARINDLLPGWQKAPGRAARATFTLVSKLQSSRFEDVVLDGPGLSVKGMVEVDNSGGVVAANFPVFSLSDGDKASLRAERGSDGALRVTMRGDVLDGRSLAKASVAGAPAERSKQPARDLDLDIRVGTVAGHHGETLRGLDLKMSRRNGNIRSFSVTGKLGRDASIVGDLRGRAGGRQVIYLETGDAGALFRFTDTYSRIQGGEMWVAMDPPAGDDTPQDGLLNIRDFAVRGEPALDRVASGATAPSRAGVEFNRLRVEFTRTPGNFAIRDGLVRGPVIGATIDGRISYQANEVQLRGTFVPLYGLNNMFGQIPIFGLFLGGSNEGLVGITYEVVGSPGAPVLRVNPISAVAPGLLRKFFEFPSGTPPPQSYAEPSRN